MIILFLKRAKHHCNTCCHFAYCPARKCDIAVGWRLHFSTQCDKRKGKGITIIWFCITLFPSSTSLEMFHSASTYYYTCLTWPALHKKWSFPIIFWNFEFRLVYWRSLYWKTSIFVQCNWYSWQNSRYWKLTECVFHNVQDLTFTSRKTLKLSTGFVFWWNAS